MVTKDLKNEAKERGFNIYNNLKKNEIIKLFESHDLEQKQNMEEKEHKEENIVNTPKIFTLKLKDDSDFLVPVRADGYVNATALCKSTNKSFSDWFRTKETKALIQALENDTGICGTKLLEIRKGGNAKLQGTYIHPDLAVQLAQWLSPSFSIQVSRWIRELLYTGSVKIERPVKHIMELKDIDIEAEEIEIMSDTEWSLNTNKTTLYVAYIGNSMVKVGITTDIINREKKHTSSESIYPQFRLLKLFEVSSVIIEKNIHKLLSRYRVQLNKQVEIYKPQSTLKIFINIIENLLYDNDLKLRLDIAEKEIMELKLKNAELISENMKLKL